MTKGNGQVGWAIGVMRAWRRQSQKALAAKAGIDASFLSLVESGNRNLSMATLGRVAKALRTTNSDIMRLAENLGEGTWRP